eukprot:CAMPEP_0197442838 /NCGR_PEP_ID=MMETSP1175-20131217/8758_1 /TAXON_ID=1003142 /ORGANISM="Triceratium dubium, Strain CCMP147" /LENGTH=397 /DNA_ID=CAMNT_0042973387 /DNA_START=84 /DNA_END=1274 /DNA_ORIENTATION=-
MTSATAKIVPSPSVVEKYDPPVHIDDVTTEKGNDKSKKTASQLFKAVILFRSAARGRRTRKVSSKDPTREETDTTIQPSGGELDVEIHKDVQGWLDNSTDDADRIEVMEDGRDTLVVSTRPFESRKERRGDKASRSYDISKLWSRRAIFSDSNEGSPVSRNKKMPVLETVRENEHSISARLSRYEEALYEMGAIEARHWANAPADLPVGGNGITSVVVLKHDKTQISSLTFLLTGDDDGMHGEADETDAGASAESKDHSYSLPFPNDSTVFMMIESDDEHSLDDASREGQDDHGEALDETDIGVSAEGEDRSGSFSLAHSSTVTATAESDEAHSTDGGNEGRSDHDDDKDEDLMQASSQTGPSSVMQHKSNRGEIVRPRLSKVKEAEEWLRKLNEQN